MDRYKPLVHEVTATVRMGCDPSGEYVKALDYDALAENHKRMAVGWRKAEVAYLNRIRELEAALRSAHDELTNAGHQELPECECKIAALLRGALSSSDNLSTGSALSDATEPREALRAGAASRDP